jgi:hypothetical protein
MSILKLPIIYLNCYSLHIKLSKPINIMILFANNNSTLHIKTKYEYFLC